MRKFIVRIGVASLLVMVLLFTFSQPARAAVLLWFKQIAGFELEEIDTFPVAEHESKVIPAEVSDSLERIIKNLPYELSLPTYIPEGFSFQDKVDVWRESVFMRWLNQSGDEILMQVDTEHGQRYLTGTDAAQEIEINGQPALLIQGGYDANGAWDPDYKMLNVLQRKANVIYWLIYIENSEGEFNSTMIQDELIRVMASIP